MMRCMRTIPTLRIRISVDEERRTVTISDNGIGMNRQEVSETIGTIANSGTRKIHRIDERR